MQLHFALRLAVLATLGLVTTAHAQTTGEQTVEELRNTLVSVMEALVQKGLLTREQAQQIVSNAQTKAAADAQQKAEQEAAEKDAVVVTRIPETVKQDIVKQVGEQVRPLVTQDVLADAKSKQWGIPGAMPSWLGRISLFGDLRLRTQYDDLDLDPAVCSTGNIDVCIPDYVAINDSGSENGEDKYLNVSANRLRQRIRLRLGVESKITEGIAAVTRLASGNAADPVSTNQTLGQAGGRFQIAIDQAYLKFDAGNKALPWMTILAGRTPNPFLSTDLVWDPDLNFDGIASTWRVGLGSDAQRSHTYLTLGAFPLQEVAISSDDKWLYAGQLGLELPWSESGRFKLAASYYHFDNITGQRNTVLDSTLLDYTAPQWMQKGNTLFDIRNDSSTDTRLFALAGEYHLANLTAALEVPFGGHKVMLTADYVRNIGYDENKVQSLSSLTTDGSKQINGYQVELGTGTHGTGKRGNWRTYVTYKNLQRDAVVDAYTDSDFHLGGTDARGYAIRGEWWFRDRTSVSLRHISTRSIEDAPPQLDAGDLPLDIAVTQLDISAQF